MLRTKCPNVSEQLSEGFGQCVRTLRDNRPSLRDKYFQALESRKKANKCVLTPFQSLPLQLLKNLFLWIELHTNRMAKNNILIGILKQPSTLIT